MSDVLRSTLVELRVKAERPIVYPLNRDECLALIGVAEAAYEAADRLSRSACLDVTQPIIDLLRGAGASLGFVT